MSNEVKYSIWLERSGLEVDDEVLASGLTVAEAAKFIREYGHAKPYIFGKDYPTFRAFELWQWSAKNKLLLVIAATVPKTDDAQRDQQDAMEMINAQIFARHSEFFPCRISTGEEFAARLRRIAEARTVRALDRKITTELVDKLLEEGYRITCCIRHDVPKFQNSRARAGILKLLFELEISELLVQKDGVTYWIMMIFDEEGWDVVADYSVELEYLIDPIIDPHLPWNQPNADPRDRGYTILKLPSPAKIEAGDPAAEKAFDDFVNLMERLG